jgi:hypothetical protein
MRYKWYKLKHAIRKWFRWHWELFRTPKDQRPVIRLLHEKIEEAQQEMVEELGRQLYGGKKLDGLGSIFDDDKDKP